MSSETKLNDWPIRKDMPGNTLGTPSNPIAGFLDPGLAAGYPLTVTTTGVALCNALVVTSDGVTPIVLMAQCSLSNTGANTVACYSEVLEGATVLASSGLQDVSLTSGHAVVVIARPIVLSAGSHTLTFSAFKNAATGAVTAIANGTGSGIDTFFRVLTFA